ncbi:MAG: copper ABC transporter permease, partial [Clostridiales bacterium]|nr:copper ABC transporter permease [Clostridiales bacterium]
VGLAVEAENDDGDTCTMLVFGTPYIFSDAASQMTANNATMFTDIVSAVVGDTELASSVIPVKSYSLSNITVTALYALLVGFTFMIIIPVVALVVGIVIFVVRRKK